MIRCAKYSCWRLPCCCRLRNTYKYWYYGNRRNCKEQKVFCNVYISNCQSQNLCNEDERKHFYNAVQLLCAALEAFAARYATEAKRLSIQMENLNPGRAQELKTVAEICEVSQCIFCFFTVTESTKVPCSYVSRSVTKYLTWTYCINV